MPSKKFTKILLASFFLNLLVSCGVDQQILTDFSYNIKDDILDLQVEFSSNVGINTELSIPILDYGNFSLTPPKIGKGFVIKAKLNFKYLEDERMLTIGKTRLLPDGQLMPDYVTKDLVSVRAEENEAIHTYIYLGPNRDQMYLGTALELNYINEHFPSGIVVTVKLMDKQQRQVGVFSIFGPNLNEQGLLSPGGFFFVTNVSDLKQFAKEKIKIETSSLSTPRQEIIEVNEPYRREYQDHFRLSALLQLFQSLGRNASYVD